MKKRITILLTFASVLILAIGLFSCGKKKSALEDPAFQTPSFVATYGETLADLDLPEGFYWQNSLDTSVGEIGSRFFLATYMPENPAKYKTVKDIKIRVTVQKVATEPESVQMLSAVYGDTLRDVSLPSGFSWQEEETTSVGNAGNNVFYATYTPADPAHYEVVRDVEITIYVEKATYDMSGVFFDSRALVYTGEPISLFIRGTLPQGVTVSYENNGKTDVGKYVVTAVFTGDAENYKPIQNLTANLVITQGE